MHSQQGTVAALRWWQNLPDSQGVASAYNSLVEISTQSDTATPHDRLSILTAGQARGMRSDGLEQRIASDFAKTDPLAGLKFFTSRPPSGDSNSYPAIGTLVREWALNDPVAAGTWLQGQTTAAWAADAIRGYAGAVKAKDPEAAASWKDLLSETAGR